MTSTAWNLDALRLYIRGQGTDGDHVLALLNSIGRAVLIFRYHMATARDAMSGLVSESEPFGGENLMFILGASYKQEEFLYAKVVSEANIIGCLYTARNLWDLFGQLLNILLLENSLSEARCNIGRVAEAMPDSELRQRIKALLTSHWYSYVAAFTNTTKHRRHVEHAMNISAEENRVGMRIQGFTYNRKEFAAYWDRDILEGAIEVKNALIECGRLLNALCLRDAQPIIPPDLPRQAAPGR